MKVTKRVAAAFRAVSAFAELDEEAIGLLVAAAKPLNFAQGEVVIRQGDPSDCALMILEGDVTVAVESAHGAITLSTLAAPCLVGEIGAFARLPRIATVRACTPAVALRIGREALLDASRKSPALLMDVIGRLGDRMRRVNGAIGLYTHALAALELPTASEALLEDLRHPLPDLADFGGTLSRIAEQILLRRQRSDEMASAAIIQRALLPNAGVFAREAGLDVAAAMTPARDIGGDFFDLLQLEDGRIAVGVGDVCGKGVPAALFMGIAKSLIRINLRERPDLPGAIRKANAYLVNNNAAEQFATVLYAALDPKTGALEYCSCGHNPGFIRRADGRVERLPGGGLPIGLFDEPRMKVLQERLSPGDLLFLYTDGLTEAVDAAGQEFGEARLAALLGAQGDGAELCVERAIAQVREFSRGLAPFDDLTCLAVRR